jgi:hypothetical protein
VTINSTLNSNSTKLNPTHNITEKLNKTNTIKLTNKPIINMTTTIKTPTTHGKHHHNKTIKHDNINITIVKAANSTNLSRNTTSFKPTMNNTVDNSTNILLNKNDLFSKLYNLTHNSQTINFTFSNLLGGNNNHHNFSHYLENVVMNISSDFSTHFNHRKLLNSRIRDPKGRETLEIQKDQYASIIKEYFNLLNEIEISLVKIIEIASVNFQNTQNEKIKKIYAKQLQILAQISSEFINEFSNSTNLSNLEEVLIVYYKIKIFSEIEKEGLNYLNTTIMFTKEIFDFDALINSKIDMAKLLIAKPKISQVKIPFDFVDTILNLSEDLNNLKEKYKSDIRSIEEVEVLSRQLKLLTKILSELNKDPVIENKINDTEKDLTALIDKLQNSSIYDMIFKDIYFENIQINKNINELYTDIVELSSSLNHTHKHGHSSAHKPHKPSAGKAPKIKNLTENDEIDNFENEFNSTSKTQMTDEDDANALRIDKLLFYFIYSACCLFLMLIYIGVLSRLIELSKNYIYYYEFDDTTAYNKTLIVLIIIGVSCVLSLVGCWLYNNDILMAFVFAVTGEFISAAIIFYDRPGKAFATPSFAVLGLLLAYKLTEHLMIYNRIFVVFLIIAITIIVGEQIGGRWIIPFREFEDVREPNTKRDESYYSNRSNRIRFNSRNLEDNF